MRNATMCEECEAGETMAESYAVKRALIARYWQPKGASAAKRWIASEVESPPVTRLLSTSAKSSEASS
jgi:hypothetical protein